MSGCALVGYPQSPGPPPTRRTQDKLKCSRGSGRDVTCATPTIITRFRYLAGCGRVSGSAQTRFHIGHTVSPGDSQSECVTGQLLLASYLTIVLPLDYLTSGAAPCGAGPGSTGRREPNSPAPPAMACTCTPGRVSRRRPHLGGCGETGRFGAWVLTSAQGPAVRRHLPASAECRIAGAAKRRPGSCLVNSGPCYRWASC
jgi:hypothetical protein